MEVQNTLDIIGDQIGKAGNGNLCKKAAQTETTRNFRLSSSRIELGMTRSRDSRWSNLF